MTSTPTLSRKPKQRNQAQESRRRPAASRTTNRRWQDETPEARKHRRLQEKQRRIEQSKAETLELIEAGDEMGLYNLHLPIVGYHAWRLQQKFEFDDFTRDDIDQVGRFGLWNAVQTHDDDRGANFHTHATRCVVREMWKEIERLNGQQKRGFQTTSELRINSAEYDRDAYVDELAETELIGLVYQQMECITERAKLVLCRCIRDGEKARTVARELGVQESSISRSLKLAGGQLRAEVMPMLLGTWYPWPCYEQDAWELLRDAQENHSEVVPVEEQNVCRMCGADLMTQKMNYCSRSCRDRFNYAKKRKAEKSAA